MRENRQGFTLVEILLTVMIVAFLGGSLYAVFAAGLKLDHRAKQSFIDLDENRLLSEQFYKDLGRVVFYDFRGSVPDRKSFSFNGKEFIFLIEDKDQLKWVRYLLVVPAKGQIKQTRLGVVSKRNVAVSNLTSTQASLLDLVRDENDFAHFFTATDEPQKREVLSRRVPEDGMRIFCSPSFTGAQKIDWESSWDKNFLPAAVRVSLSLKAQSGLEKKLVRDYLLPSGGRDEP